MRRAALAGVTLEYEELGAGEPVVCVHGAFVADAFRPLLAERGLTSRYRVLTYRRRGYGGSGPADGPATLAAQAADCRMLLLHLGLRRAHVVGHSFGGAVALRLALDAPELVRTLTVLEPGLLVGESASLYRQGLERAVQRYREVGARTAVDEFLRLRWPAYRAHLDRVLPGAFEQAVADAATAFEVDLRAVLASNLGEAEARRIAQPVLVVLGGASVTLHPRFEETYRLLLEWLPDAAGFVLPGAAHLLHIEEPRGLAHVLVEFLESRRAADAT